MVLLRRSFLISLSFVLPFICTPVIAAPWIVTDAYQRAAITTTDFYYGSTVITSIQEIQPTANPVPEAFSTITSVSSNYYGYDSDEVTVIQKLYPTGVGEPVADTFDRFYDEGNLRIGNLQTIFVVNLTYSAPTGCSSQWTRTTAVEVIPPPLVQSLLPRTATTMSVSVDSSLPFQATTYTYDVVYVDPTQLPSSTLSSISAYNRPTSLYIGADCGYNSDLGDSYYHGYYHSYGADDNWFMANDYSGTSLFAITLICSIGWIGLFIILGFVEAWIRFRRLMTGWQTRRGLPVFWALTIIPITLLLLFCFRKGYRSRSEADAEILRARWKAMSIWTKLRLFFVWGFRYKYPPMLGPAPARVKTSKQPGKNPGPRLLEATPPRSVAPDSRRQSAEDAAARGTGPQMTEASLPASSGALSTHEGDHAGGRQ